MAALPFESKPALAQPSARLMAMRDDPRIRLAQLARLHNEAAETATLANLLGRAPQALAALSAGALVVAGLSFGTMPSAELVVWLALVGAGLVALWRAYGRAIEAPFELSSLKSFADDLCAILFYAGFAWGAGAFLALGPQVNPAAAALFAALPCALVVLSLRARLQSLFFLGPVCALTLAAIAIRPLGGLAAAGLVVVAGALIASLSLWIERFSAVEPVLNPVAAVSR
jgi:energy-converting hydrogenase Eha subunit A